MIVDWTQAGPCRSSDPEEWFPLGSPTNESARKLCAGCPILHPCREYALRIDVHGVWGGLTRQRRRLIQRQRGFVPAQRAEPSTPSTSIPVKALALWTESERLRADGLTIVAIAEQLGISAAYLVDARSRARKHLGVAS